MNILPSCEMCGDIPDFLDMPCEHRHNCPYERAALETAVQESQILAGKVCPYCFRKTSLEKNTYGWYYECFACGATVGCHRGTTVALGRLANKQLRTLKKEVHAWFDPIWQSGKLNRSKAYSWLADQMGIEPGICHIGMFDEDKCKQALTIIKSHYYKL